MADKIKVYIRNEEVVTGEAVYGKVTAQHGAGTINPRISVVRGVKTEKVVPEADRTALAVVKRFTDDKGLQVEICSLGTFTGRLKARQKGVKMTPTIVIGKFRIEGELTPELLRSKLELAWKK